MKADYVSWTRKAGKFEEQEPIRWTLCEKKAVWWYSIGDALRGEKVEGSRERNKEGGETGWGKCVCQNHIPVGKREKKGGSCRLKRSLGRV